MQREDFETLVSRALDSLPRDFQDKLDNVEIVIEDLPTFEQARSVGLRPGMTLFGLYQGVPKTKRGAGYILTLPDKITIFQKPLEFFYRDETTIKAKVRETVLHEIGHHFGLNDAQILRAIHSNSEQSRSRLD